MRRGPGGLGDDVAVEQRTPSRGRARRAGERTRSGVMRGSSRAARCGVTTSLSAARAGLDARPPRPSAARRARSRQHVVDDTSRPWATGPADADLDAAELVGAEGLDHRAHAVVAAGAALHAHAHRAQRQVEVVVDEDQVCRARRRACARRARPPGRTTFMKHCGLTRIERPRRATCARRTPGGRRARQGCALELRRPGVQHALAHVVAGVPVLGPGVAEPDHRLGHAACLATCPSRPSPDASASCRRGLGRFLPWACAR